MQEVSSDNFSSSPTVDISRSSSSFSVERIWSTVCSLLDAECDPQIFAAFIKPLKPVALDPKRAEFVLAAPSRLVSSRIEDGFKDRIAAALCTVLEIDSINITVKVEQGEGQRPEDTAGFSPPYVVVKKVRAAVSPGLGASDGEGDPCVDRKYTFSNFVVGNNNQFCHAASLQVAEKPGLSYNPLFIYGGVGLGKTHLLHAIGNAVLASRPSAKVLYISSEYFTNELIRSLKQGRMAEFKSRFRGIELLLVDDIQFMSGKESTQEEFFHTFNELYKKQHQIVITSDKIPQEIPGMEERLHTRFSWGLTADIQAPDFETRVAILNRRAGVDGFQLPADVAELIASKITSNVRELEGALTRLHAISSLKGEAITFELAQVALRPMLAPKTFVVSVSDIKRVVADQFGLKISELISKRRTKNLSFPRHISMYLCRKHTTSSYPEIGGHFGGRDHSSVIHAARVVSQKIEADPSVRAIVEEVERRLFV